MRQEHSAVISAPCGAPVFASRDRHFAARPRPAHGGCHRKSTVRPFTKADVSPVADLFQETFRGNASAAVPSLKRYLANLILHNPWNDGEPASRVFVSERGGIEGFIGGLPTRMTFRDRPVRAVVATSIMVRNACERPFAGAMLLRSLLAGPQDLSYTDSASDMSCAMARRLGATVLPAKGADWVRFLRPFGGPLSLLVDHYPPAARLRALADLGDGVLSGIGWRPCAAPQSGFSVQNASAGDLLASTAELEQRFALRPDWDRAAFAWRLRHACGHERRGALVKRVVRDRRGALAGCYFYRVGPGAVARVLHVIAMPRHTLPVLAALLDDAARDGAVAVCGRLSADLLDALLRLKAIIVRSPHTLIHARDPAIIAAAKADDLFFGGLAGESWTRLVDDTFA